MPELPEVETISIAMRDALVGCVITEVTTSSAKMRFPIPPDLHQHITGGAITRVWRRAKYILIDITHDPSTPVPTHVLLLHLGMSGAIRIYENETPPPRRHDHLCLQTRRASRSSNSNAYHHIVLNDPRRFGGVQLIALADASDSMARYDNGDGGDSGGDSYDYDPVYAPLCAHPLLRHLGIEPQSPKLTAPWLHKRLTGRTAAIKTLLLDQRLIVGIGNIYAAEALFKAKINPSCQAKTLTLAQCKALVAAIKGVLKDAVAAGGTSLRNHVQPDGAIGYFAQKLHVYGRDNAPCTKCKTPIQSIRQGGRASFFCPRCQKLN
ncbi:MAG: bifunctional DNA-formamidopyrimidine glycosylase/DNA-(apurinic or apyrimidinic site) lyase [Proteobacteria bacterium]|nr:bifunctional DNA-formamidopyrimidine glycosylase/DNA-(apurinic or apyrimidinic site) lyase [Pseudomonadota bacterium]